MNQEEATIAGWHVVEMLGHRRTGAYVREVTIAGAGMLRLDVPGDEGAQGCTMYIRPETLYCLTPVTERVARGVAAHNRVEPARPWELVPPPDPGMRRLPERSVSLTEVGEDYNADEFDGDGYPV